MIEFVDFTEAIGILQVRSLSYVYKRVLSGLSICIGLTYLTILLISVMMAYHLLKGGFMHVQ